MVQGSKFQDAGDTQTLREWRWDRKLWMKNMILELGRYMIEKVERLAVGTNEIGTLLCKTIGGGPDRGCRTSTPHQNLGGRWTKGNGCVVHAVVYAVVFLLDSKNLVYV